MSGRKEDIQDVATARINKHILEDKEFKQKCRHAKTTNKHITSAVMHFGMGNIREGLTVVSTKTYPLENEEQIENEEGSIIIPCDSGRDNDGNDGRVA